MRRSIFGILAAGVFGANATVIARWDFNEGVFGTPAVGANAIKDFVGGHHGTPYALPVYTDAHDGTALQFNGTNNQVRVPDAPAFQLSANVTIATRVRFDGTGQGSGQWDIFFRGDDRAGNDPYVLTTHQNNSGGYDYRFQINSVDVGVAPIPPDNAFHTVFANLDVSLGVARVWVDGTLQSYQFTSQVPVAILTGPVPGIGLGNTQGDVPHPFKGAIDWIEIRDDMPRVTIEADLGNFVGNPTLQAVQADLVLPGTNTPVAHLNLVGGSQQVDVPAASGTYDIVFHSSHFLTRRVQGIVLYSGLTVSTTLDNGDADQNNVVDLFDMNLIFTNFGLPSGAAPNADVDGSGTIDLGDLNVIFVNFSMSGDQ